MTGKRYVVTAGDSLWTIARARLGDGHQWKRLWRYNNRRDVVQITGRGIPDADRIYPGQLLLVPVLPGRAANGVPAPPVALTSRTPSPSAQPLRTPAAPAPHGAPSLPRIIDIESPMSVKYRLDDLKFLPIVQPGAIVDIKM